MTYILTRSYDNGRIVLMSDWADVGPRYDRDTPLPHTKGKTGHEMTGKDFVKEKLRKNTGDPNLGCNEEGKLIEFGVEFLTRGLPPEWVELSDFLWELRSSGVKLPAIEVGPSIGDTCAMRG